MFLCHQLLEKVRGTGGRRKREMGVREAKRCKVKVLGFIYIIFERVEFIIPILNRVRNLI